MILLPLLNDVPWSAVLSSTTDSLVDDLDLVERVVVGGDTGVVALLETDDHGVADTRLRGRVWKGVAVRRGRWGGAGMVGNKFGERTWHQRDAHARFL